MNLHKVLPIDKFEKLMRGKGEADTTTPNDIDSVLEKLPQESRESAKKVLEKLKSEPHPVTWDSDGHITYKNKTEYFARIDQLIELATTKKRFKSWAIPGLCAFLTAIVEKEVPISLLSETVQSELVHPVKALKPGPICDWTWVSDNKEDEGIDSD